MDEIKKDQVIRVMVTGIVSYGIFVSYGDYTGLIHISEISDAYIYNINTCAFIGECLFVKVLDVDYKKKKLKLSIKSIDEDIKKNIYKLLESKNGFNPLKESLPKWTNEKIKEYNL